MTSLKNSPVPIYGDMDFRGDCPLEKVEQASIFNWLRVNHPQYYAVAVHIRNEDQGSARKAMRIKAEGGMVTGASDVQIPGCPSMVCEVKRRDMTKGRFQKGQPEYLQAAKDVGAFACVALGAEGFVKAFYDWERLQPKNKAG